MPFHVTLNNVQCIYCTAEQEEYRSEKFSERKLQLTAKQANHT